MKKIFIAIIACACALVGCQKVNSLLDTENYQAYDTTNFPKTEQDAVQIVTSIYNAMPIVYTDPENSNIFRNVVASDDMFGAGSTSNTGAQSTDRFMEKGADESQTNLKRSYQGIFRANYALEVIPELDDALFSSADYKNYLLGQAHFLRAWFFWELAEKFETFPVKLSTATEILPRGTVDEGYEAITNDLLEAIRLMPAKYGYTKEDGMSKFDEAYEKISSLIDHLRDNTAVVYGAFYDEKIVGFIWAYLHQFREENRMYVSEIRVKEEYRSRGIGKSLLKTVEAIAKEKGFPAIYLHAEANNPASRHFYENNGYVEERIQFRKEIV